MYPKCPRKNSYEKENDKWAYEEFEKESPTREEKFLTNILGAVVSRVVSDCIYFLICKLKLNKMLSHEIRCTYIISFK